MNGPVLAIISAAVFPVFYFGTLYLGRRRNRRGRR